MNHSVEEFDSSKEYLSRAIAVLELMAGKGARYDVIFAAAGEYWQIIRRDLIERGICRPIGTDNIKIAPDRKEMIAPTLAHYRYLCSELEKREKDRRLDVRIKKSGAWTGWLAIIISIVSLSLTLCSRCRGGTETLQGIGTSSFPDTHKFEDSPDNPVPSTPAIQSEHIVSDKKTTACDGNVVSSKAQ